MDQSKIVKPHFRHPDTRIACFNMRMTRVARFILALIVGLALLTWAASGVVQTTAREWFERDVNSRAQLVLTGARQSLADAWNDPVNLQKQLVSLARDERVMGAAACNADLTTRSSTPGFPAEFNCLAVGPRVRNADTIAEDTNHNTHEWSTVATLPTGRVQVSAMPISAQGQELGFAILVHDLSYIERREAAAQTFLIVIFGILAVMAFGIPFVGGKTSALRLEHWNCAACCAAEASRAASFSPFSAMCANWSGAWPMIAKTLPDCGRRNA